MPGLDHLAARLRDILRRALLKIAALEAEAARADADVGRVRQPPQAG